jgi:predicted metal-dependent TIM-barrel fold hydrolase
MRAAGGRTNVRGRLERIAELLEQYAEEIAAGGEHGEGGADEEHYHDVLDHQLWLARELDGLPEEFSL